MAVPFAINFAVSSQIQPQIEFDVASVKPVKNGESGGQRFRNARGSLEVLNMEPTVMIRNAYRLVVEGQLLGFPQWADRDCFDIEARVDEDPTIELEEARSRNLLRLQTLLVTRFQLKFHWETRMEHGYELVVAKKGPKLRSAQKGSPHTTRQGQGALSCTSCTMSGLTTFLSNFVEKPVEDKTGISGVYDFSFTFEPLRSTLPPKDGGLPSLFTALEDELGLKLEPRKLAVKTLVVERLERPSPN